MAKKGFKSTFSFGKLAKKLDRIIAVQINVLAKNINKAIQDNTKAGTGINPKTGKAKKFRKLSPTTEKIHGGGTPLNRTGKMRETRIIPATRSKHKAIIVAKTFYGAFHNTGYKNPPPPTANWVPNAKIEKREWFGIHESAAPGGEHWRKAQLEMHLRIKSAFKK